MCIAFRLLFNSIIVDFHTNSTVVLWAKQITYNFTNSVFSRCNKAFYSKSIILIIKHKSKSKVCCCLTPPKRRSCHLNGLFLCQLLLNSVICGVNSSNPDWSKQFRLTNATLPRPNSDDFEYWTLLSIYMF